MTFNKCSMDSIRDAYIPGYIFQILRVPRISRDKWISWDIFSSWSELATVFVRLETWHRRKLDSS